MQNNFSVQLSRVTKRYQLHHEKPTLIENVFNRTYQEEFIAINNLNLEITKGEKLGIIGKNGSGKTTLLKLISGITAPTDGKIKTLGKIVSLIEIDAGFHPDLTGEENIYLNGMIIGMSRQEINAKFKEIVTFADIGKFIDAPMYTYSLGMQLRLGFSVAVFCEPEILILDELLSVGDENFQKKSEKKIIDFFKAKKTIIMASHDTEFLHRMCNRLIYLENGTIVKEKKIC